MSEVTEALARARAREDARAQRPGINYALARKQSPAQKAALTRAVKSRDREKVISACLKAMEQWEQWGCWPDNWARWQRALDDVFPVFHSPNLRDL